MAGETAGSLILELSDEPITLDGFDDSDYPEDSHETSLRPVVLEPQIPNHLLLVSLLENLIGAYEKDPVKKRKMFRLICKHFDDMNLIPSWEFIENFTPIRAKYSSLLHNMMTAIGKMMNRQMMSTYLSLPSTAAEKSQALLGIVDPRTAPSPDIRPEEVFNSHTSRYKTEFVESGKIGHGGFGSVYKVKNMLDKKEYAVKKITLKNNNPESAMKVLREVQLLARLDHANIVGYNASWLEADPVYQPDAEVWSQITNGSVSNDVPRDAGGYSSNDNSSSGDYQSPSDPLDLIIEHPSNCLPQSDSTPKAYSPMSPLESCSKTLTRPATVTKTSLSHDHVSMVRKLDFDASSKLTEIIEMDPQSVETSLLHTENSEPSKSSDSLDELFNKCALDGGACAARTCGTPAVPKTDMLDKQTKHSNGNHSRGTQTKNTCAKYDEHGDSDDSELSIRFEDSTHHNDNLLQSNMRTSCNYSLVQSESVETNCVTQRHMMTEMSSFEMTATSSGRVENKSACLPLIPKSFQHRSDIWTGDFGFKNFPSKLSQVKERYKCNKDSDLKNPVRKNTVRDELRRSEIDGKLDLAVTSKLKTTRMSYFQKTESSRAPNGAGAVDGYRLFPGFAVILYIQMQLCSRTLAEWLQERNEGVQTVTDAFVGVNVADSMKIFEEIMKGVDYIHSHGMVHRDLKPKNIFLEGSDHHVRIGDFGLAIRPDVVNESNIPDTPIQSSNRQECRSGRRRHTSGVGTATYASPEQLDGSNYDSKADMYSAGIILFELFHPFTTAMERGKCLGNLRRGSVAAEVIARWPKQSAMMERLVSFNSKERPTADEVLLSELFVSNEEMISRLQNKILEQSKLLGQRQKELGDKNAELVRTKRLLKEKDALILELLKSK